MVVAFAAVVLQADGAALGDARQLGLVDNLDSVEHDRDPVTPDGNLESVPLAHGLVGLVAWSHARPDLRRHRFVHAVAVELTRPDGPALDVDLVFAGPAQENTTVGIGQCQIQFFSLNVAGVRAVGQDVGDARIYVGRFFDPPVHM